MSAKSKLTSGLSITPGSQIVNVISAEKPDGNAALVLKSVAQNRAGGMRTKRNFPLDWKQEGSTFIAEGHVSYDGKHYPLILKIGSREGLVLQDGDAHSLSMKPINGEMVLHLPEKMRPSRVDSYANELVACWVVHGKDWYNRVQQKIRQPWGLEKKSLPEKLYFNVIDGALAPKITLKELISLGCGRSTHVGEWHKRHSTLIPAFCDMPITMHEFKEEGEDVCFFNGMKISNDREIWGPYCQWDEQARRSSKMGMWQELALKAGSPFAFHVHATRTLFPGAQLDSSLLLEKVGREKLMEILETIEQKDPERFYRLIDEQGVTHRIHNAIEQDYVAYGSFGKFPRHAIVPNVMASFEELNMVQNNCARVMRRMPRIVPDTHFYLVVEALLQQAKSVYALSGRDMHRYLTEGGSAHEHCIRNERLFLMLRDFFDVKSIDFHVYPPLTMDSGLISQYSDARYFDKEFFLSQKV